MKQKRKISLIMRLVGSSNPLKITRRLFNKKPDAKVYWERIRIMNNVDESQQLKSTRYADRN